MGLVRDQKIYAPEPEELEPLEDLDGEAGEDEAVAPEDCALPDWELAEPPAPEVAPVFELGLEPALEPALAPALEPAFAPDLELSLPALSEPEFAPAEPSLPEALAASPPLSPAAAAAAEAAIAASLVLLPPPLLSLKSVTYQPEPLS